MKLEVFNTPENALRAMTGQLTTVISHSKIKPFHLALSGGDTAQQLFRLWTEEYREQIDWNGIRFYWVDERCVAPDDNESNFKYADELLFTPLNIPPTHVHRIFGEQDPEVEAGRYSELVKWELPGYAAIPRFDCIILGVGTDLHTASIFPSTPELLTDSRCYAVSQHPVSGQKRITMTGTMILKARKILLPAVGSSKTETVRKLVSTDQKDITPAAYILSHAPDVILFTDCQIKG